MPLVSAWSSANSSSGASQVTRILRSWTADLVAFSNYMPVRQDPGDRKPNERTIELTLANSMSFVTATVWTRNLSLHLASGAGSSFMACNSTIPHYQPICSITFDLGCPTLDFHMFSWLYPPRVWPNAVAKRSLVWIQLCGS